MSLYLVRHGSAGKRSDGATDDTRPLDTLGRAQAAAIAQWFEGHEIDAIYSSPAVRCVETVQPLATARRLSVEVRDELAEGYSGLALVATLRRLASASVPAVLCSHGDLIPAALDALAAAGVPLAGKGGAKGSIWVLRTADGQILEGRYIRPPG